MNNKYAIIYDGSYTEKTIRKLLNVKQVTGDHVKCIAEDIQKRSGGIIVSQEFHQGTPHAMKTKLHAELIEMGVKVVNYEMKTQSGWSDAQACNVSMTVERATDVGIAVAAVLTSLMRGYNTIVVTGDGDLAPAFHRLAEFRIAHPNNPLVVVCAASSSLSGSLKAVEYRFKDTDGNVYNLDVELPRLFGVSDAEPYLSEVLDKLIKKYVKLIRKGDMDKFTMLPKDIPVFKLKELLFAAIEFEQIEAIEFILERILSTSPYFQSNLPGWLKSILTDALLLAAEKGERSREIISILIGHGADPNRKRKDRTKHHDMTPLMIAVYQKRPNIVQQLIDAGADPNICTEEGETSLMIACSILSNNNDDEVSLVSLLIDAGASLNLQGNKGKTALMYAASNGNLEVVKLLLSKGADPDMKSLNGWTAARYADMYSHNDIMNYLLT